MSQLDDAVAKYNKLLESGPYRELAWVEALHQRMETSKLSSGGRLICPFLRPNFITRRHYEGLVKTGEAFIGAIDRMEQFVADFRDCTGDWLFHLGNDEEGVTNDDYRTFVKDSKKVIVIVSKTDDNPPNHATQIMITRAGKDAAGQ